MSATTPRSTRVKGLNHRHIHFIALGSAIGTGLFYGSADAIQAAGPSVLLVYLLGGIVVYALLRALGEMSVNHPMQGSFAVYTRAYMGKWAGYITGWMFAFEMLIVCLADLTAIGIYMKFWFPNSPQWIWVAVTLLIVGAANLASVNWFGEMEFVFTIIKVGAVVAMIIGGAAILIFGLSPADRTVGFANLTDDGGFFPNGAGGMIASFILVLFAFGGTEIIGVAGSEAEDPDASVPKAVNTVPIRILIFYVLAILIILLLNPWRSITGDQSPFVQIFDTLGVSWAAALLNIVVITAALSSLNAGLYSTGRIVRSLSLAGSAPEWAGRLNKSGVPFGGIALTAIVGVLGVIVNFVMPGQAFEVMINMASVGVITCWASICLSHLKFVKAARAGQFERPDYKAPFYPVADYLTLIFLAGVVILMGFDKPIGTWSLIVCVVIVAPALFFGWKAVERSGRKPAANVDFEV